MNTTATKTETYTGGYTVLDQRTGGVDLDVVGHYPTLTQAAARAKFAGSLIIRTVGQRYDVAGAKTVSRLIQRCGVMSDGTTFVFPA